MYGFKHVQFIEHSGRPEHPAGVRQGMDTERVYLGVSLAVLISFTTYYAITLFLELCRSMASIYTLMSCPETFGLSPFSGPTRMQKASRPLHGREVSPHASPLQDIIVDNSDPDIDSLTGAGPCSELAGTILPPVVDSTPAELVEAEADTLADKSPVTGDAGEELSSRPIGVDAQDIQGASELECSELAELDASVDGAQHDASAHSPLLLPAQTPLCTIEECDYEDSLQPSAASAICLSELSRDVTSSAEPRCEPAMVDSNDIHHYGGATGLPVGSGLPRLETPPVDVPSYSCPQPANPVSPAIASLNCPSEYVTPLIGADPAESMVTSFNVEGAYSIMHSALFVATADAGVDDGNHMSGAGADAEHDADWTPIGHDEYSLASTPVDTLVTACGEGGVKEQLSSSDTLLEDSDSTCATYASSESYFAPPDALRTEDTNPPILLAPPSSPAESSRTPQVALSETTNSHTPLARPFSESIMMDNDYIGPLPKAPRVRVHTPENPDWAVAPDEPVRRPSTSHRSARGEKGKQRKGKDGAIEEKKGSGPRVDGKRVARASAKASNIVQGQETGPPVRRRSARLVQAQT
ncbi:hypothetical protein GY45DRAFT_1003905 [Cubamyces sp. BRFM 1775]|nr:hypothetical protein GY45DRAFT_1003905 [Cubamyces sp. BRFM 1775]